MPKSGFGKSKKRLMSWPAGLIYRRMILSYWIHSRMKNGNENFWQSGTF
jgi:hypothetical protein